MLELLWTDLGKVISSFVPKPNFMKLVKLAIAFGVAVWIFAFLSAYSEADIQAIEDKLNQRPRKRLDFCTPQQVFDISFNRGALRS